MLTKTESAAVCDTLCTYKTIKFLYKGIIIKHNKTEPTYTKTSLFLYEKRRFFMAGIEKGVVLITYLEKEGGNIFKLAGPCGLAFFNFKKRRFCEWRMTS